MRLTWVSLAAVLFASPAIAQDVHLKRTAQPAAMLFIQGYWLADKNCEPSEQQPTLLLDKPPEHGFVCYRRDMVTMRNIFDGADRVQHCLGRQIRGLRVVYQPRMGYGGLDDVRYTVVFPKSRRTIFVDLIVLPGQSRAKDDVASPADIAPQSAGPIPECAALVS
jgi:hypothetical protein